jgi:hypothetical protein
MSEAGLFVLSSGSIRSMSQPLPPETEAAIRASLSNTIHAIKLYREATGVGLREAKGGRRKMAIRAAFRRIAGQFADKRSGEGLLWPRGARRGRTWRVRRPAFADLIISGGVPISELLSSDNVRQSATCRTPFCILLTPD